MTASASSTRTGSSASGRYTAPSTARRVTDSGTSEMPMPAATNDTSVAVSETSGATVGAKPWREQTSSTASCSVERKCEG